MQVRHGFAAVGAVVDYNAEASAEIQFFREGLRRQQEMTEQSLVTGDGLIKARDKSLREDQHVHWRLRLDVVDGETQVILMDDLGGDLTVGDFLENGLGHGDSIKAQRREDAKIQSIKNDIPGTGLCAFASSRLNKQQLQI